MNNRPILILRGKRFTVYPFVQRFIDGQTKEHNALSKDGHTWEVNSHGQTRHCTRCFIVECCANNWVPVPNPTFSMEDVVELIKLKDKIYEQAKDKG